MTESRYTRLLGSPNPNLPVGARVAATSRLQIAGTELV